MPAYLGLNVRSANPQLWRVLDATPAAIGVPITGASADNNGGDTSTNYQFVHSPVRRVSTTGFVAVVGGKIYLTTDKGATWSSPHTFNTTYLAATLQSWHSGIHKLHLSNGAPVYAIMVTSGSNYEVVRSIDHGVTWSSSVTYAAGGNWRMSDVTVWRNRLVTCRRNGAVYDVFFYEPNGQTISVASANMGTNGVGSACLLDHNGSLYLCCYANGGGGITTARIYQYVGSTALQLVGSADGQNDFDFAGPTDEARWTAWSKGGFVYLLCYRNADWRLIKIPSNMALPGTDIGGAKLPAAVRTGTLTQRVKRFYDSDTDPANPVLYVAVQSNGQAASAWTLYRIESDETWTFIEAGGIDGNYGLPFVALGQGGTFWTDGQKSVDIRGWVKDTEAGKVRISYVAQSDDGLQTLNLFGFFKSAANPTASQAATLEGTTTNILADNSTLREVVWNASADGVPLLERDRFVLKWV